MSPRHRRHEGRLREVSDGSLVIEGTYILCCDAVWS
jgi:hypothetical protein